MAIMTALLGAAWLILGHCSPEGDATHLLQVGFRQHKPKAVSSGGPRHYWPMARGRPHHYSQTSFGLPVQTLNLTGALAWSWEHPAGLAGFIWGTLIDSQANIYVASMPGIFKLSPGGQTIWHNPVSTSMPSLMGDALYGMSMVSAEMFAVDLETGKMRWTRKVAQATGMEGDMVEAYNGVIIAGVDMDGVPGAGGVASKRVIGVNASNGHELWSYEPECGLWNIMALFPDNDTTAFMDKCGGVYRLDLHTGALLWHTSGSVPSFTDGGATLGPDGSIYTCSSPLYSWGSEGTGRVRKYRLSDGERLWEAVVPSPCVNFPAVSSDGASVVLADGGLALDGKTKEVRQMPREKWDEFYALQLALVANNTQRAYYHMPDLNASILALDTRTGALQWRHEVPPYGGVAFAMDEERAWNSLRGNVSAYCWPAHWGGVTVDDEGTVYIGRSTGSFYVYKPKQDLELKFRTNDGFLMAGVSFAPGMMVVPTCSFVHVFKY